MRTSIGVSELVGNIMASYDARIKAVGDISRETAEMCRRFRSERKQNNIPGHLAKEGKNRLKEYNIMMSGVNKNIDDIRKEVVNLTGEAQAMLAGFRKERKNNDIKDKLADGEKARQQEYHNMMDGINKDIDAIRKEVINLTDEAKSMLAGFRKERENNDIRVKLADGEKTRQQEYNGMMDGIHDALNHIHKEVTELTGKAQSMIAEFRQQKQQMCAEWQTMGSKKHKAAAPARRSGTVKKTVTVRKKKEAAAQPAPPETSAPPEASVPPTLEPKESKPKKTPPLSLPEAIVEYIGKHGANGVKIGELEKPLGASRLKLGKIAKELLDQGRLRKEDNLYFPQ
ncbi:MAG: hypothetical protein PHV82_13445 [Victivallaceae bacterium]|nr:hypothetical protein [Victivallaceae bacterium]